MVSSPQTDRVTVATHSSLGLRDSALAVLVALVWGVNFVVIHAGLQVVPPLLFLALRFLLVCLPAVFFVPRPDVGWRAVVLIGVFMSLGQFALLYLALYLGMPTGLAPLVIQVQVLFTVLLAAATLGEHPRVAQLAGVVIGLAGLSVVALGRAAVAPLLPLLLVVAAAASWAVGNVLTRTAKAASGLSMVVWSGLVVPVPMAVLSYLVEGPAAIGHALTHLTPVVIGSALFTAWLSSLLGYGIWNTLLARHPASSVVPFAMLVPVVGMASAFLLLGERSTVLEIGGGVVLLAGVAISLLPGRQGVSASTQSKVRVTAFFHWPNSRSRVAPAMDGTQRPPSIQLARRSSSPDQ